MEDKCDSFAAARVAEETHYSVLYQVAFPKDKGL